jgi:hypothetical protein
MYIAENKRNLIFFAIGRTAGGLEGKFLIMRPETIPVIEDYDVCFHVLYNNVRCDNYDRTVRKTRHFGIPTL